MLDKLPLQIQQICDMSQTVLCIQGANCARAASADSGVKPPSPPASGASVQDTHVWWQATQVQRASVSEHSESKVQQCRQQADIPNRCLLPSRILQRLQNSLNTGPSTTSGMPIKPHKPKHGIRPHERSTKLTAARSLQSQVLSRGQWLNSSHCCLPLHPLHPLLPLPPPPLPASGWCDQAQNEISCSL